MSQQYYYTPIVIRNFILVFCLFLITEALIFGALFWAWFYFSINPAIWGGSIWPLAGIQGPSPFGIAFYNTVVLFTSSCSLIWTELAWQLRAKESELVFGITLTMGLGIHFIGCQLLEFSRLSFTFNDGVYGSNFYSITGLHFIHICIGLFLLLLLGIRAYFD